MMEQFETEMHMGPTTIGVETQGFHRAMTNMGSH